MNLDDHFGNPRALLLLGMLPLLACTAYWSWKRRLRRIAVFRSEAPRGVRSQLARGRWLAGCTAVLLACAAMIVALAKPLTFRASTPELAGRNLMLVLDASRSMFAEDLHPNRFEAGRRAILAWLTTLDREGPDRIGLVVFASGARLACPLTTDYEHLRSFVEALNPHTLWARSAGRPAAPVSGTRIGAGLQKAVEALSADSIGAKSILLISDGDDPVADGEWGRGVEWARGQRIPVHVVGLGNAEQDSPIPLSSTIRLQYQQKDALTKLRIDKLRSIADATGGLLLADERRAPDLEAFLRRCQETTPTEEATITGNGAATSRPEWLYGLAALLVLIDLLRVFRPD